MCGEYNSWTSTCLTSLPSLWLGSDFSPWKSARKVCSPLGATRSFSPETKSKGEKQRGERGEEGNNRGMQEVCVCDPFLSFTSHDVCALHLTQEHQQKSKLEVHQNTCNTCRTLATYSVLNVLTHIQV